MISACNATRRLTICISRCCTRSEGCCSYFAGPLNDNTRKTRVLLVHHLPWQVRNRGLARLIHSSYIRATADLVAEDDNAYVVGQVKSSQANFVRVAVDSVQSKGTEGDHLSTQAGRELLCVVRGLLKKIKRQVLVGDRVRLVAVDWVEGRGMVEDILPRTSVFPDPPVANVDQVLLVFGMSMPGWDPQAATRFLVASEAAAIPVLAVLNKADLVPPDQLAAVVSEVESWGYTTLPVSASTGAGLEGLARYLQGKVSVVVGPSGVGKSSLINALKVAAATNLLSPAVPSGTASDPASEGARTCVPAGTPGPSAPGSFVAGPLAGTSGPFATAPAPADALAGTSGYPASRPSTLWAGEDIVASIGVLPALAQSTAEARPTDSSTNGAAPVGPATESARGPGSPVGTNGGSSPARDQLPQNASGGAWGSPGAVALPGWAQAHPEMMPRRQDVLPQAGAAQLKRSPALGPKPVLRDRVPWRTGSAGGSTSHLWMVSRLRAVGELSQIGRGKHTTRHVSLIDVGGGLLADSPGFNQPDLDGLLTTSQLPLCFPEIRDRLGDCAFSNCQHLSEPGCAVREGWERQPWYAQLHAEVKELEALARQRAASKAKREGTVRYKSRAGGVRAQEALLDPKKNRRVSRRQVKQRTQELLREAGEEDEDDA
eukprot:jgi/Botrbrau1/5189/Bobra.0172s0059.1